MMAAVLFTPPARKTMPHPPEHKLRWYQYKLSSLFILTTLVALACSWYATVMHNAAKRRAAIAEIEKLGGSVKYYNASDPITLGEPPSWYSWLRRLHGDEHLGNAVDVFVYPPPYRPQVTDAGLVHLKGLTNLVTKLVDLWLWDTRNIDAGLVHLKGLTKLERLQLKGTQVGDAGLVHLEGLTNLKWLNLRGTKITDAGLVNLKGLTQLKGLLLNDTQVTDAGLVHLKGLANLGELDLHGTQITDAGLVHLKGLTKLEWLWLEDTQVTDAGLVNLKGLTQLKGLLLNDTQVTDEGVKNLQQALPNCDIYR